MSIPQEPKPAKLVIGFFLSNKQLLGPLAQELSTRFGSVDIISSWMPFDYTSYYEREMGTPLFRRLISFERLIHQSALAQIKLSTNQIEQHYCREGKRRVNIDPGYLVQERFVLASGKNYSHRIYLSEGIYADLTLIYHQGRFQQLPWTYPDYADHPILRVLERIRLKYVLDMKKDNRL